MYNNLDYVNLESFAKMPLDIVTFRLEDYFMWEGERAKWLNEYQGLRLKYLRLFALPQHLWSIFNPHKSGEELDHVSCPSIRPSLVTLSPNYHLSTVSSVAWLVQRDSMSPADHFYESELPIALVEKLVYTQPKT